ncbi:MAG: AAA family ATPase [Actinomycetota bacterium]|nr:AAA family ATPase [Actinomycetota bacterium]
MTPLQNVLSRLQGVKQRGKEYSANCPGPNHKRGDKRPSLNVSEGEDGRALVKCQTGCETADILTPIGLELKDLFPKAKSDRIEIAAYRYDDASGNPSYETVRFQPKEFGVKTMDGKWGLNGQKKILYRLPQLIKADKERRVFIVEGEKHVDKLIELGLVATCNPFGALKWLPEFSEDLRDRHIVILPDADPPEKNFPQGKGKAHAEQVAELSNGIAASIKVIELPGLPEKGDIMDWLAAGHTKAELIEIVKEAPLWEPNAEPEAPQTEPFALPLVDFMAGPTEVPWLWDEIIAAPSLAILAAKPKFGKTLLSFNLAIAASRGRDYLGRAVKQTNVLIVQLEDPPIIIRNRLLTMGAEGAGIFIRAGLPMIKEDWQALRLFIVENQIGLAIIDPFIFAIRGNEQDATATGTFLREIRELIFATDCSVLLVHHHRKGGGEHGDAIRGSSAILGAVDVALEIVREDENDPAATLKITSRFASIESETLSLDVESLTWRSMGSAKEYKKTRRENEIMTAIEGEGEADIPTLSDALNLDPSNFRADLKRLVADGLVNERKEATKGRPKYWYSLAADKSLKSMPVAENFDSPDLPKDTQTDLLSEIPNPGVSETAEKPDDDLTGFSEVGI